jgi:hypothetical protein
MKKLILSLVLFTASLSGFSQELEFGLKVGISSDKMKLEHASTFVSDLEGNKTYNFGVYGRFKVKVIGLYVQPEAIYNTRASNITITDNGVKNVFLQSASYIDIPVLVGLKFLKVFRVYGGPNFQMLVSQKTDIPAGKVEFVKTDLNKKATGMQLGAGLDLAKFRFDAKYDFNVGDMGSPFTYKGNAVSTQNAMFTFQVGIKLFGLL